MCFRKSSKYDSHLTFSLFGVVTNVSFYISYWTLPSLCTGFPSLCTPIYDLLRRDVDYPLGTRRMMSGQRGKRLLVSRFLRKSYDWRKGSDPGEKHEFKRVDVWPFKILLHVHFLYTTNYVIIKVSWNSISRLCPIHLKFDFSINRFDSYLRKKGIRTENFNINLFWIKHLFNKLVKRRPSRGCPWWKPLITQKKNSVQNHKRIKKISIYLQYVFSSLSSVLCWGLPFYKYYSHIT